MNDFQFDIFAESLKELQQEKKRLENVFESQRAKRKDSEAKLNLVIARFSHVSERHSKVQANRDIAKQKVKESREIVKRLQQQHSEKQAMIAKIQQEIEQENKKKDEETILVSDQLEDLAKKLFNAQKYFNSDNLENELLTWKQKAIEASNEASEKRKLVHELGLQLADINISDKEEKPISTESLWPELEELENTIAMFQEEQIAAIKCKEKCEEEISRIKQRVNQMKENSDMAEIDESPN